MIRFRNRVTGSVMWVHESRYDEYVAAGHLPAAPFPRRKTETAETPGSDPAAEKPAASRRRKKPAAEEW